MKFSDFVPKYSTLTRLLECLNKEPVGKIYNITKKVEKLPEDFSAYQLETTDLEAEYNFSQSVIKNIKHIHEQTGIILSSKYITFAERHSLIEKVEAREVFENETGIYGCYIITQEGRDFINKDLLALAKIDEKEMLLFMLEDMSGFYESCDLSVIISVDDYFPLYDSNASYQFSETRVQNLLDRKLLSRRYDRTQEIYIYKNTKKGLKYLENFQSMKTGKSYMEKFFLVTDDIEKLKMIKYLSELDPFDFEVLISLLLTKMGYQDVEVTTRGNDNGIDVIAKIEIGTSMMKEIIQVKRWKKNVQRPTLDQLRGVLSTSNAIKGSIITTSDFSSGCYENAKSDHSVNLINGEKLINFLLKYEVGFTEQVIKRHLFTPENIKLL